MSTGVPGGAGRRIGRCVRRVVHVALARGAALTIACAAVLGMSAPAVADEFIDRLNRTVTSVPEARRAELVLLPAVAAMQAPPRAIDDRIRAGLLLSTMQDWPQAKAWVEGAEQRAALDALATVTKESDPLKAHEMALQYGADATPRQLVRQRMYIELGDPPLIAGAELLYLPPMERLVIAAHVEATRLAAEGKVSEAIDVLSNLAQFGRMMVDRPLQREALWGLELIAESMERIRDVVYLDTRGARAMNLDRVRAQVDRIRPEGSFFDMRRTVVPLGEVFGAQQALNLVYAADGTVDGRTFATTLARLGSVDFPLRTFSESARWRSVQDTQANKFDADGVIRGIGSDFARRWQLDWWDRQMQSPSPVQRLDRDKFAVIAAAVREQRPTLDARQIARLELSGTRLNIALAAVWYNTRNMPTNLPMTRPRWIDMLDVDMFDASRLDGRAPTFQFFIPTRDRRGLRPGEEAPPFVMNIVPPRGLPFSVPLRDDVWVLYSLGSDSRANGATRVQNTATKVQSADYLIWPPMISLYRQHLLDTGDLK